MQFKVGDQVVHTSHGSGQIVAIEEKRISGSEARLYYAVATDKCTVWVPVNSNNPSSLRPSVAGSELAHCREVLRSRPAPLNVDRRQRYLDVNDRLRRGTFEAMCEVVRDLAAHGWPKPLNDADALALRNTQDSVCREWAYAAGVSLAEATQEIAALLEEGRRAHG